jgi:hypothetical protein
MMASASNISPVERRIEVAWRVHGEWFPPPSWKTLDIRNARLEPRGGVCAHLCKTESFLAATNWVVVGAFLQM